MNKQERINRKESIIQLKDGRIIYKTHNGFKFFCTNNKGLKPFEVTEQYYNKAKLLRLKNS